MDKLPYLLVKKIGLGDSFIDKIFYTSSSSIVGKKIILRWYYGTNA